MNLETLKAAVTSKTAVALFKARKNSPHILFGAGVVGFGATVYLAVRATNKVSQKVDDAALLKVDADLRQVKLDLAGDIAKQYALPLAVGLASLGCFGGAHYILNKRNGVLLVAYGALDRAYSQYRKAVSDEVGEEREREIYHGVEAQESREKMANGTEKVTQVKGVRRANNRSPYAVCFDEQSHLWTREPGMNEHILEIKRAQANDKFMTHGHLFLNEVYDLLGLPRSQQGAVVGWIYDPQNQRSDAADIPRDNFVTFGLWLNDPDYIDDIHANNHSAMGIWLDFNVDGVIWDKI
jgi:hypothetical protein